MIKIKEITTWGNLKERLRKLGMGTESMELPSGTDPNTTFQRGDYTWMMVGCRNGLYQNNEELVKRVRNLGNFEIEKS